MIGEPGAEHRVELHDIVAGDEHTIVLWTRIAQRGADRLYSNGVGVYHVVDGKITEVWVVHEDQYAADEFFS
jgi:ketosteroid isomerase-like protein